MRTHLLLTFLLLFFLAAPARSQEPLSSGRGTLAIVSVPLANVREDPEPKANIVTQVLLAEQVRILEKEEYRYRISIPDQGGLEGWVNTAALLVPRDHGAAYYEKDRSWVVISVPRTPARILDSYGGHTVSLYGGTRLPVLETTDEGRRVLFPDRQTSALVRVGDTLPLDPARSDGTTPGDVGRTARKFAGIRYFAGGLTEQGMDTRGLIYIVYRIHGIDLNMDLQALKAASVPVQKQDLLPGDVLVFHGEGLGLSAGNGHFVHATERGRVQIDSIHDRRYARALRSGMRILGADPEQRKRPAEMTADEIMVAQGRVAGRSVGARIAYWAGRFIGTPYDTDPLGLYVRTNRIVADEAVDCMYLTFRAVELAESSTPGEAIEQALQRRFFTEGKVAAGIVQNYAARFEYGEDMVYSGKWGRNITDELGSTTTIAGSRGREQVIILPKKTMASRAFQKRLRDGDIIYWVKDPKKRVVDEIVAHLGIIRVKDGTPYLIHASGSKNKWGTPNGGVVKEVPFADYLRASKFIGAYVTRFEE